MERVKKTLTSGLLAFVLISIGFALGKHSVPLDARTAIPEKEGGRRLVVYYLHSTFRCVTCNTIEEMTRSLLHDAYGDELSKGTIQWIEADFQENEALAQQFEVIASCVVVAEMVDGKVTAYQRLDDVWSFMDEPENFNRYISQAIDGFLQREGSAS